MAIQLQEILVRMTFVLEVASIARGKPPHFTLTETVCIFVGANSLGVRIAAVYLPDGSKEREESYARQNQLGDVAPLREREADRAHDKNLDERADIM